MATQQPPRRLAIVTGGNTAQFSWRLDRSNEKRNAMIPKE